MKHKVKRAECSVENRNHPFWGKCDCCGFEDILMITTASNGALILVCSVCANKIDDNRK